MPVLRAVITGMLVFTLLGIVLGTLVAPKILTAELCGLRQDIMTNRPCAITVEEATTNLVRYQLYSAAGGAILGFVVGIVFAVKSRKKAEVAPPPSTTPATGPTPAPKPATKPDPLP